VINPPFPSLRVALAHHWLVGMRGGEKVLEQIGEIFPTAPIYTLVARPDRLSSGLQQHAIHNSWLQRIPGGPRHYKKLLPFFPRAVSALTVREPVDLVISSDASVIKGLRCPPGIPHVCYCHSPPRYLWDLQHEYANSSESAGPVGRALFERVVPYVREFDRQSAGRVTHFVANSHFVRERILLHYGRKSEVIHPPVYLDEFEISATGPEDFYLVVSQLVPYKRIDLAVAAFNRLKKPLVIIGEGSERARLEKIAGPTIRFLGSQPQPVLKDHYRRARALIFPGIEDFGITPLEAQAAGRPVLAYRMGGSLETIIDGETGLFFDEQTPEALIDGVERYEKSADAFTSSRCRQNAERFSATHFRENFADLIRRVLAGTAVS
jgi:glycosyltransferase involved in cell wall biosynthesis